MTTVHNRYDGRILKKECVTLSEHGYDVYLLVNDNRKDEVYNKVKIISTGFNPRNRIDRIINSRRRMYERAIQINADIYHFHDPELIPLANKLKKMNKIVIFDSHEDVPSDISDKPWIPIILRKPISVLYFYYEKSAIKNYDAIITVTPHIVDRIKKVNSNVYQVTNYPIVEKMDNPIKRIPNSNICFAGAINETWNHEVIIKAIEGLNDTNYILAGPSTDKYISTLKKMDGWHKVDYLGLIPKEEVEDKIYNHSSVGMALNFSQQLTKGKGTLGNNKFFEYMLSGIPIICSNYELWKEIVDNNKCGIAVDPNDYKEVREAIKFILSNPDIAKTMGQNGKSAIMKQYNWEKQGEILIDIYSEIVSTKMEV